MRKIALLAVAALVAGCGKTIVDDWGPMLEFSAQPEGIGTLPPEPQLTVTEASGRVTVDARVGTPDPCRRLTATFSQQPSTDAPVLQVDVRIEPEGTVCVDATGVFRYRATVHELDAGRYRLRVRHQYVGTGFPEPRTVLDREVMVR